MTNDTSKSSSNPTTKKMPVAGKSGKDGVTAEFRIKDQPVVTVPGKFQPH